MLSSDGPVPLSATIDLATGVWSCTFDQALQPGPVDIGNWSIRRTNQLQVITTAVASGNVVAGATTTGMLSIGPDVINWSPPPFDVVNAIDQPSFAFAGFPLTVT